jgi:polysaccharide export outer membrane protein
MDNTVSKRILDLTRDGIIQDKDFYLLEDDIVYVMPLESRKWGIISSPWSLTLSTLTTLLVILNFFVQ